LKEQLGTIANTTYNGQYLFSGTDIDTPPYSNGTLQNTSQSGTKWDVGKGVSVNVNVSAGSVFGLSVDGKNLFETIDNLAQTLDSGQNPSILLTSLDKQIDNVSARHTIVGANQNLLQLASNRLDQASNLNQKILSNIEDTDIAKAYTELSAQQATINASLAVGAKIIQPTLADFLK
jgi:flagellar hook-associated protein 3 FlgL